MSRYWCRFFDAGGHVFGGEIMDAENDVMAIAKARVVFAHGIGSGYEIWDGKRLVLRHTHTPAMKAE
jgi:hypothetical protein